MRRRTVSTITHYPEPKIIYRMITRKSWSYAPTEPSYNEYVSRDRCFMALGLASAGRVTAIIGGPRYLMKNECECGTIVKRRKTESGFAWICPSCEKDYGKRKPNDLGELIISGKHSGLQKKNFVMSDDFIVVKDMEVIKRKQDTIDKYGRGVAIRDPFRLPLRRDLYKEEFIHRDQMVPFSWLIKEYLDRYMKDKPKKARLFNFGRRRGWEIVNYVTGEFPNWFRSQSEHFHGHYLIKDSVKLSKFVKVVNPNQVGHYIGYSDSDQLKDSTMSMDFKWIDRETRKIKRRISKHSN